MNVVCDHCDREITEGNRRWPGYDGPACREAAARQRDELAARRRAQQAEVRARRAERRSADREVVLWAS